MTVSGRAVKNILRNPQTSVLQVRKIQIWLLSLDPHLRARAFVNFRWEWRMCVRSRASGNNLARSALWSCLNKKMFWPCTSSHSAAGKNLTFGRNMVPNPTLNSVLKLLSWDWFWRIHRRQGKCSDWFYSPQKWVFSRYNMKSEYRLQNEYG